MIPEQYSDILTVEEIKSFHERAIHQFGGAPGVREEGCVHGKLQGAINASMYRDEGLDILSLAADLLVKFAKGHCFVDGNKRIAWLAAIYTLRKGHLRVSSSQAEAALMVEDLVESDRDLLWAKEWFATRLTG